MDELREGKIAFSDSLYLICEMVTIDVTDIGF